MYDRLCFGPRPGDLDAAAATGVVATVGRLLSTAADPGVVATPAPTIAPQASLPAKGDKAARARYESALRAQETILTVWWLDRMVAATRSTERLTWFWHGHFATSAQKVRDPGLMLTQNATLRQLGAGPFTALAQAMVVDPAMLVWLDGGKNQVGAANENLAREFMELFTLGVDTYSEDDVRAAARALTGWTVDKPAGTASLRPKRHDTGSKTLLGTTANLDARGFVDVVLGNARSPGFLAGRLWARMVSDRPPGSDTMDRLVAAYGPGRDIRALLLAIAADPAFTDSGTAIVKQPVEWAVGLMRATGVRPSALPPSDVKQLLAALTGMGQVPFLPPNVGGWPAGPAWLTTSAAVSRLAVAALVSTRADLTSLGSGSGGLAGRVESVRVLLGVDSWSARTREALAAVASSPAQLLQAAACSPEYVVSA